MSDREEILQAILTAITNMGGVVPARRSVEEYSAYRVRCLNYLASLMAPGGGSGGGIPATNSIATAMIQDIAVSTAKIADSAITTQKLAASSVDTTKIADTAVTTTKIADTAVTTTKIADSAITAVKVADGAISTAKLADGAVTASKIQDSNITLAKLAPASVDSSRIVDGTIASADLADSVIVTTKIADGNVTAAKVADGAIITAKVADGAITSAKIADGTITSADLSPDLQTVIAAAGVGAANFNPNFFLAGPSSGVAAPASARAIVPADLPLLARNPGFIANVPAYAPMTGTMRLVASTETLDPLNAHSTSSGMFTVPAGMAGVWMLGAFIQTVEYGRFLCYATVNTTVSDDSNCLGLATQSHTLMRPYNLAAGDVIRWYVSYAEGVGGPGITIMNSSKVFAFLLFPTG